MGSFRVSLLSKLIELNNRVENLCGAVRFVVNGVRFWNLARSCEISLNLIREHRGSRRTILITTLNQLIKLN